MKTFMSAFASMTIAVLGTLFGLTLVVMVFDNQMLAENQVVTFDVAATGKEMDYEVPSIDENRFIVKNDIIKKNASFNWKEYVICTSSSGIDLTRYVTIQGEVDTTKVGANEVMFILNWNGKTITKKTVFYVED